MTWEGPTTFASAAWVPRQGRCSGHWRPLDPHMLGGRTAQGTTGQGQNPLPRPIPPAASAELGTARAIPGQPRSDSSSGGSGTMEKVPGESGKRVGGPSQGGCDPQGHSVTPRCGGHRHPPRVSGSQGQAY